MNAYLERADFGHDEKPHWPNYVQSFSLAGVARTALLCANNFRTHVASTSEVCNLCHDYIAVEDPDIAEEAGSERLGRLLIKIAYEQFPRQLSPRENIGRSTLLMLKHAEDVDGAPTCDEWKALLGVELDHFLRIGFSLYVAAMQNPGSVNRDLLLLEQVQPIFQPATATEALEVVDRYFASSPADLAAWGRHWERKTREKWSPNPLQDKPIVAVGDELILPAPEYLINRITPNGLYFIGLQAFGTRFTDALGTSFERYVGKQLEEIERATVYPEIPYGTDRQRKKSCDYLVVFDRLVLLIEAKTARSLLDFRIGESAGVDDAKRKLGRARDQLTTTARLLAEDHPAFDHIPKDRPIRRLIVTLEPYFLRQTFMEEVIFGDDPVPVASAHDLEVIVGTLANSDEVGTRLFAALSPTDRQPADLIRAIDGLDSLPNKMILEAWDNWATWETTPGGPGGSS